MHTLTVDRFGGNFFVTRKQSQWYNFGCTRKKSVGDTAWVERNCVEYIPVQKLWLLASAAFSCFVTKNLKKKNPSLYSYLCHSPLRDAFRVWTMQSRVSSWQREQFDHSTSHIFCTLTTSFVFDYLNSLQFFIFFLCEIMHQAQVLFLCLLSETAQQNFFVSLKNIHSFLKVSVFFPFIVPQVGNL